MNAESTIKENSMVHDLTSLTPEELEAFWEKHDREDEEREKEYMLNAIRPLVHANIEHLAKMDNDELSKHVKAIVEANYPIGKKVLVKWEDMEFEATILSEKDYYEGAEEELIENSGPDDSIGDVEWIHHAGLVGIKSLKPVKLKAHDGYYESLYFVIPISDIIRE
jgi:hypothetical protein